jgi:hypothetical protein
LVDRSLVSRSDQERKNSCAAWFSNHNTDLSVLGQPEDLWNEPLGDFSPMRMRLWERRTQNTQARNGQSNFFYVGKLMLTSFNAMRWNPVAWGIVKKERGASANSVCEKSSPGETATRFRCNFAQEPPFTKPTKKSQDSILVKRPGYPSGWENSGEGADEKDYAQGAAIPLSESAVPR